VAALAALLLGLVPLLPPLERRVHPSIIDAIPCATPSDGAAPKPLADRTLAGIDAPARRITAAKAELEAFRQCRA
jgi:hypothetical protein